MNSLRQRLNLGLALTLIAVMVIVWWLVGNAITGLSESLVLARLEHDSESLLVALSRDGKGNWSLNSERVPSLYQRSYSGHYFVIGIEKSDPLLSRSLWNFNLTQQAQSPGNLHWHYAAGPDGQRLLVRHAGYQKGGANLTLSVAEDISPVIVYLQSFRTTFALVAIGGLVIALLIQQLVLQRSFRSLERLRGELQRLESGELTALSETVPSEVQPLVREVNRLLGLLGQRLQRSRNALGNLAHALKTPLSVLRQLADAPELNATPALRAQIDTQVERLRELTERELKRARLAGAARPGQHFQPAEELAHLEELIRRIHRDKTLTVDIHHGQAAIPVDHDDMLELLGNLLDNAAKWARGTVRGDIRRDGDDLWIEIEDDGPGVDDTQLHHLAERGARIDENVGGHGLGLAIVSDVVELYGGHVDFDRSPTLGGLRIRITLPLFG